MYSLRKYSETFNNGGQTGFNSLFRKYYAVLCLFANRFVGDSAIAEDIVAVVFERLWATPKRFADESHARAFLYASVRYAALYHLRGHTHAAERQLQFAASLDENEHSYELEVIRAEVIRELYQAIQSLPEQCSKIISLTYIDGLSNQEAADALGLSIHTIKAQKQRGLALLRGRIDNDLLPLLLIIPALAALRGI